MIKLIALAVLVLAQSASAGLPPTTSKISSDSNDVVTFKYRFPNFTGTHTGATFSLGVNAIAGGGTNKSSYTDKSVPYYDTGTTALAEDNANFNYNSGSKQLTLGLSLKLNNPAATESFIENTATDGDLRLSGGSSATDGGTIYMYATGAGGGNGGDIDFVAGTGTSKFRWYEHTATNELFSITDTGIVTTEGGMTFKQLAGPSSPAANYDICYTKSDDKFYCKSSAGTESLIGPSSSSGGTDFPTVTISSTATLSSANYDVFTDPATGGGAITVTLFSAVGNAGHHLNLKQLSAGTVNITTTAGQSFEFDTSGQAQTTAKGQNLTISSDGSNWYVF